MTGPPKLVTFQRSWHFKPAKSASKLRNTLRNSDADVGNPSAYEYNIKRQKCVGMGLNGFLIP